MYWYNKFSITTFWFPDCLDSGYNRSAQINLPNFLCSESEQNLYFVLAIFFYAKCTCSKASMLALISVLAMVIIGKVTDEQIKACHMKTCHLHLRFSPPDVCERVDEL
jgi:hypothetical protein